MFRNILEIAREANRNKMLHGDRLNLWHAFHYVARRSKKYELIRQFFFPP